MTDLHRRQILCQGLAGLAVAGSSSLLLAEEAAPTDATPDLHNYQDFLDKNGIPQVAPTSTWEPTHPDILGPFHVPGAPFRGKVTAPLAEGTVLVVRGRIWGYDTKKPVTNSVLDVWQADHKGRYDMNDPRKPPAWHEFQNRIRLVTDETGYYEYETIRPAAYRAGRGVRPAHIHYMVQALGYQKLITQLYFKGDPNISRDRSASRSNLLVAPQEKRTAAGRYQLATFDIVLARGGQAARKRRS